METTVSSWADILDEDETGTKDEKCPEVGEHSDQKAARPKASFCSSTSDQKTTFCSSTVHDSSFCSSTVHASSCSSTVNASFCSSTVHDYDYASTDEEYFVPRLDHDYVSTDEECEQPDLTPPACLQQAKAKAKTASKLRSSAPAFRPLPRAAMKGGKSGKGKGKAAPLVVVPMMFPPMCPLATRSPTAWFPSKEELERQELEVKEQFRQVRSKAAAVSEEELKAATVAVKERLAAAGGEAEKANLYPVKFCSTCGGSTRWQGERRHRISKNYKFCGFCGATLS